MISAGQHNDPRMQQGGYSPPVPQAYAPPPQAPFVIPQVQTSGMQPAWPSMTFKPKELDDGTARGYLWGQFAVNAAQAVGNIIISGFNIGLAREGMQKQYDLQVADFALRDKVAGYQKEIAYKQLTNQESAIKTQAEMHKNQTLHEEEMRKLEGRTQERLAKIAESGKTERARFLSVSDAFNRRDYSNGATV